MINLDYLDWLESEAGMEWLRLHEKHDADRDAMMEDALDELIALRRRVAELEGRDS